MNIKAKRLTILIAAFLAVVLPVSWSYGYGSLTDTRPRISEGEYAIAWVMVQNIMSKHNYYYAAGNRIEELSKIWVKEDGEFARTATITTIDGVWEGMDVIKIYYGNPKIKDTKQTLKDMGKSNPWEPAKGQLGIYTNTTPIIEVAGDGKTARGVWFSQGMEMNYTGQKDKNGNEIAQGSYYFEKYGADFVKENGEWKIWHIQIYSDFKPSVGSESKWTTPAAAQASMAQKSGDKKDEKAQSSDAGLPKPTRENPDPYEQWSSTRENKMRPELPEPYYTFDETSNY
jgi:hypothetical protein